MTADEYHQQQLEHREYEETMNDLQMSSNINELATALAKAQGSIKGASKDSANPFFKSKYADLAAVWDACRDALSANNLAVVQTTSGEDVEKVTVITTLIHSSGQWMRGSLVMRPVKNDPQGIGSVITYARRYALAAMVGVAPEDDDGNAASGKTESKVPAKVTPDPVDADKVFTAAAWFREMIDADQVQEHHEKVKAAWERLGSNERMEVHNQLDEKAPNSNKMYKNLLKEYLNYVPGA